MTLPPTQDMNALLETQASRPSIYLAGGRWLDGADEDAGNRVCVVNASFAAMRGLEIGDTLPLELRDAPSSFGYLDEEPRETAEETYEIVGLYEYVSQFRATSVRNTLYVPASTIPESFVHGAEYSHRQWRTNQSFGAENGGILPLAGQIFFILNDPDAEAPLLAESEAALKALGYEVQMLPVNWEEFQAAGSGHCPWVCRCVREASLPLLLIGLTGVLPGWLLGWWNTVRTVAETLESLASLAPQEGTAAALSPLWLAALLGIVLVLFAALTVGAARFLSDLGSGSQMEITYNEGWDETLFTQDWSAQAGQDGEAVIPVIIPRKWARSYVEQAEEDPDQKVYKAGDTVAVECNGEVQVCMVAGGVAVLFVMLSAKEAAILRVQGTTKLRTVLMLSLQQVFTCFAGLAIGLVGILLYIGGTRPDLLASIALDGAVCAALYLAVAVLGAAASSAAVTSKNPLEMLQVKE